MKHIISAAAFAAATLAVIPGLAQSAIGSNVDQAKSTAPLSQGEIRKVDKEAKKLTIKHGPLENLDMPGMTMVFQVRDPAVLNAVKAGDKVKFTADKDGSAYVVTRIEVQK
jgi:Cu(I)/Ag(I) efflux system protein CusF